MDNNFANKLGTLTKRKHKGGKYAKYADGSWKKLTHVKTFEGFVEDLELEGLEETATGKLPDDIGFRKTSGKEEDGGIPDDVGFSKTEGDIHTSKNAHQAKSVSKGDTFTLKKVLHDVDHDGSLAKGTEVEVTKVAKDHITVKDSGGDTELTVSKKDLLDSAE